MKLLNGLAAVIWILVTLTEKYVMWMCSPIRFKSILFQLYLLGTSIYFMFETNVRQLVYVSHEQGAYILITLLFWFLVAFFSLSRIISGGMANIRRIEEKKQVQRKKG